jgi:riboflavin kinase/FMN adenylyltransferase
MSDWVNWPHDREPIDTVGLGVFDGIHRGHRAIADQCSHLMTFCPYPRSVLHPEAPMIPRLTLLSEMRQLVPNTLALRFTRAIAELSAAEFFERIVVQELAPKRIVVGEDFHFGAKRSGHGAILQALGASAGIDVVLVPLVMQAGEPVKSGRIRTAIQSGQFNHAVDLLGHPYSLSGSVVSGDGRGRTLGFPTANLALPETKLGLLPGVYAGYLADTQAPVVVYSGSAPTFDTHTHRHEVHILDYDGNLYGQSLSVMVTQQIRGEMQFASTDALQAQIQRDIQAARP